LREMLNLLIGAAKALKVEGVNGNNELHPRVLQGQHNIVRPRVAIRGHLQQPDLRPRVRDRKLFK
jgi:hypothetical protein